MVRFKRWLLRKLFNEYERNIIFACLLKEFKNCENAPYGTYTDEKVLKVLKETKEMFI